MSQLDARLRELADEQDALRAGEPMLERLASRLEHGAPPKRRRVPLWLPLAAALVLSAVSGFVLHQRSTLSVTLGKTGHAPALGAWFDAPESNQLPLEFSDGSTFELAPKSKARLVELERASARVELASGSLRVHVVPGRKVGWRIDAGPFGVRITGTRFVVSYGPDDDTFELWVEEGQVELTGCVFGAGRKLAVGQRVRASCVKRELAVSYSDTHATNAEPLRTSALPPEGTAAAPLLAAPPASLEAVAEARRGPVASASAGSATTWFSLAKAGKHQEAYAAVRREGFEAECSRANAEALTMLADVARHARAPRQAEHALLALRRRFPGSAEAGLAAFSLGRLEFDEFRAHSAAAGWFRTYLKERPGGAMAREALGRLMEAAHRAGDRASAEETARRYLRDYPSGPHAELASRLVPSP